MARVLSLIPRPAFAEWIAALPARADAGTFVSERDGLGLASVMERRGGESALAERVREVFGFDPPLRPARAGRDGVALVGTGPAAWLAVSEAGGNGFARDLGRILGSVASVVDQSDGYAVLLLSGPAVRATLAKGLAIDLHPRSFRTGDALVSSIDHIGVIIWQVDDAPTYDLAVFRSLAGSFWHWLVTASAEYGLASGDDRTERGLRPRAPEPSKTGAPL